ncbi:MAG TPA: protein kinase [Pirellulales bacterium]|nr:protein kinase [Pirellulales bacterium]
MTYEERIDELLTEVLETDRTPEDVCAEEPQLLTAVRARLNRFRAVEAQVNSLFPPTEGRATPLDTLSQVNANIAMPSIPDYDVERILGHGGMGIVYKAHHLKLNRDVALKMLLTGSYASRQEHARFVREAEAIAALRHPHIVQVYDIGEVDGHPYYTMEFVDGGSLAQKLAGTTQPVREAAEMVSRLAEAVQAAHESGIVHRDLKPGNILLADGETPKITDFGLARRLDRDSGLTHTGARIGTPSYMAPEQMTGGASALSPAVDIFALGAILYEMLTGRPPFQGESLSDIERKLTTEDPLPPAHLNPKVPRDLQTICLKCLEKDPRARYPTAGELAADLDRFLHHEPIRARPIAPAERAARWIRRNPLLAALAVTSVVLIALIASAVTQEWAEAAARRAEKMRLNMRLDSGIQLVQAGRFAEARAILGKLGDGGFAELRQRIDRVLDDLTLVENLELVEERRATVLNAQDSNWRPNARAAAEYEALLASAGIGKAAADSATVAARIKASDVRAALVAAVDDWSVCESDARSRDWLLAVAQAASADQCDWQKQYHDPVKWSDPDHLAHLAETAPLATVSVLQLRALCHRLAVAKLDVKSFRARVQQAHVNSLLANLALADALRKNDPLESLRYYQAALAIRPDSSTAHNNLAVALVALGRREEAIAEYQRSLEFDPRSTAAHYNLARELSQERPGEAVIHFEQASKLDPKLSVAYLGLGEILLGEQRYAEAAACLNRGLAVVGQGEPLRDEFIQLLERCEAQGRVGP